MLVGGMRNTQYLTVILSVDIRIWRLRDSAEVGVIQNSFSG